MPDPVLDLTPYQGYVETAELLGINSDEELTQIVTFRNKILDLRDWWLGCWKDPKEKAHATHASICERERIGVNACNELVAKIDAALASYLQTKQQEREELQSHLFQTAESAKAKLQASAEALMADGKTEEANDLLSRASGIVVPVLPQVRLEVDGVTARNTWVVRITDKSSFIKAVAGGLVPEEYLEIDSGLLKKYAERNAGLDWPGVIAYQAPSFSRKRT